MVFAGVFVLFARIYPYAAVSVLGIVVCACLWMLTGIILELYEA
jgi:hypothetical protein